MGVQIPATYAPDRRTALQWAAAAAAALFGLWIILWLVNSQDPHLEDLGLTALLGAGIGIVFQRTRFCILCMIRDGLETRNYMPLLGLLLTIVIGSAGYLLIFGAWIPDPAAGWLPPNAFIGPVGIHLVVGGLLFGTGMALSSSCISSHLYRGAEGNSGSWIALAGVVPGFILGYSHWDFWYLNSIQESPVIWLPEYFGYSGAALLQFGGIAVAAAVLLHFHRSPVSVWVRSESRGLGLRIRQLLTGRWSIMTGAVAVGAIGAALYFRLRPLGVTSEISRYARLAGRQMGILQQGAFRGLDEIAGCTPQEAMEILSQNGVLITALVGGSLIAALSSGRFRLAGVRPGAGIRNIIGGILLGYGAMISLGCSIGTFLSGTMAFSLSGWIFGFAMIIGAVGGLRVLKRFTVDFGCSVPSAPAVSAPRGYGGTGTAEGSAKQSGVVSPELPLSGFIQVAGLAEKIRHRNETCILLDTGRSWVEYQSGHVPGAVWFDYSLVYEPQRNRTGMFPENLSLLLSTRQPAETEATIVVYDQGDGRRASRTAIALAIAGWKQVQVLNGGFTSWVLHAKPVEGGIGPRWKLRGGGNSPSFQAAEKSGLRILNGDQIAGERDRLVIVDTRSLSEYTGARRRAERAGHIPGAYHWEWKQALAGNEVELASPESIRRNLEQHIPISATGAGGPATAGVVFYCQSGVRASHSAWLFHHLYPHIPTAIYDASWEEWGNNSRFPVEKP